MSELRPLLYLSRDMVKQICADIDPVEVIRDVFRLKASGLTILPDEAYLGWESDDGVERVRSLNMPAYVGGEMKAAGTKIINANPGNPARNRPRASGLTLLFDTNSGQIVCLMEGAYISALRTSSVSLLAIALLAARPVRSFALIGAGAIGAAHAELALKCLGSLERLRLFDLRPEAAATLAGRVTALSTNGLVVDVAASAEDAVRSADVVVTATTVTSPYLRFDWIKPGAVIVNVSLDDLDADVFLKADRLFVDDWHLVRTDTRRLLGKLHRLGLVSGPGEEPTTAEARPVDGEIGDLVVERCAGRRAPDDIIVVNPFGLGIEDVALADRIYRRALAARLGVELPV
jgi:ornithine cyclodeaminase/alanine dehydrogenase-like protein (mu-crystallin family)